MRVLILRPEPGNAATARAVAAMGNEPVCVPLFDIVPVAWSPPDPAAFDAVAMTSANAARLGGPGLRNYRHLPLFAVGEATAKAAREAGFVDIRTGTGDGQQLATLWGNAAVLHLTGPDHVPLTGHVATVAVYEARPRHLTSAQIGQLTAPVALIHSPRAADAFASMIQARSGTAIVAISEAAATVCGPGWRSITVADAPREQAMLESLVRLCNTLPQG